MVRDGPVCNMGVSFPLHIIAAAAACMAFILSIHNWIHIPRVSLVRQKISRCINIMRKAKLRYFVDNSHLYRFHEDGKKTSLHL